MADASDLIINIDPHSKLLEGGMNYHLESWLKTHLKSRKDRRKKVVKSQPMLKDNTDPIQPYRDPMPKGWVEKVEAARKQVKLRIQSETGRLTKDGPKLLP